MFNREEHIAKMKKASSKLIKLIKSNGYDFKETDGELDNVVFSKEDFELKISHRCFYRISGCAVIYKSNETKKGQMTVEPVYLTPEMFYDVYMKDVLRELLDL